MRLIRAAAVADDLAAARISAGEQAQYLIASFLIWLIPAYLLLFPAPRTNDAQFFWWVWLAELALIVLSCVAGIKWCLTRCRFDPARNFLIDFSCLNAPVSLSTLIVVWGAFYLVTGVFSLGWIPALDSPHLYDLLRMLASASAVLVVFIRVGRHMDRISSMRESAVNVVPASQASSAARR